MANFASFLSDMAESNSKQTIEEKLDKALEYKDLGNTLYKEGNYKAAAGKYHRAILFMKVKSLIF